MKSGLIQKLNATKWFLRMIRTSKRHMCMIKICVCLLNATTEQNRTGQDTQQDTTWHMTGHMTGHRTGFRTHNMTQEKRHHIGDTTWHRTHKITEHPQQDTWHDRTH